jgi:hypothetical protein
MKAIHHHDLSVLFDGPLPGWLLAAVLPSVLLVAWWLYRRECGTIEKGRRLFIMGLRLTVLAFLVFCFFMPRLVIDRKTEYPGRVTVLVDNSLSMQAADSNLSDMEAVRLARNLGFVTVASDDPATVFHRIEQKMADVADVLNMGGMAPGEPAGAAESSATLARVPLLLAGLREELATLTPESLDETGRVQCEEMKLNVTDLVGRIEVACASSEGRRAAFEAIDADISRLTATLRELQQSLDAPVLEKNDGDLAAACAAVRKQTRAELVRQVIENTFSTRIPDPNLQYIEICTLEENEPYVVEKPGFSLEIPVSPRKTDLAGRLASLAASDCPFPLSGIVVVSDGRDLRDGNLDRLLGCYVRDQVAVSTAGIGGEREPWDLAVVQVRGPSIGIVGREHRMEVHVKAEVPSLPVDVRFSVLRDGSEISTHTVSVTRPYDIVYLPVTPDREGMCMLDVHVAGECEDIFSGVNNRCDTAFFARTRPVRVLLLDDTPRWQTRFVLNILNRLPYVNLNGIIRTVDPDHQLRRGDERGTWPVTPEALAGYELIVVGDIERGLLSDSEWAALRRAVEENGATLCFLAPQNMPAVFSDAMSGLGDVRQPLPGPGDFALLPAGFSHPLTSRLWGRVPESPSPSQPGLFVPILVRHDDGSSLLSWSFLGKGKVLVVGSERLWQGLNPQLLDAHSEMFTRLVDWSILPQGKAMFVETTRIASEEWLQAVTDGRPVVVVSPDGGKTTLKNGEPIRSVPPNLLVRHFALDGGLYRVTGEEGDDEVVAVCRDNVETAHLAQDHDRLRAIASHTGGTSMAFDSLARLIGRIEPKSRRESVRNEYAIWNLHLSLVAVLLLLSLEWIIRKVWNLV